MSAPLLPSSPSGHDAEVSLIVDAFVPDVVLASLGVTAPASEADAVRYGISAPTDGLLHERERAYAESLPHHRRVGYVAGRRALRAALHRLSPADAAQPLLATHRGAPRLPEGFAGSISHKRSRAIAVAAPTSGANPDADRHAPVSTFLGVDLEDRPRAVDVVRPSISRRILTAHEQAAIAHLDPLSHRETTLVYFALKEAVYKTIDPFVERYVRFTEVELDVDVNGTAVVRLMLPELAGQVLTMDAHWRLDGDYIMALVRTTRHR